MQTPSMPIGFIVLAAGAARRYGGGKLAAPVSACDATPVLGVTLNKLTKAIPSVPVVVVVSEAQPALASLIDNYPVQRAVVNGQSAAMSQSIASAMPMISQWAGCFICLGDMPYIEAATYQLLYRYASLSKPSMLAPTFAGQRGHPVYFDRQHFPALASLSGKQGAAKLLNERELKRISVTDPGVIQDIDYPSDHQ